MSCTNPRGIPVACAASKAASAKSCVVRGCEECPLAITGFPAATAAAKSPPAALLNAKGKLFGPNTATGPSGPNIERMFALVSIVAAVQVPSRAAAAACRSWLDVRGSSTSFSRGCSGSAVSRCAASTSASARASIRSAYASRNAANRSPGHPRISREAAEAAPIARSISSHELTGYVYGSGSRVAGFTA